MSYINRIDHYLRCLAVYYTSYYHITPAKNLKSIKAHGLKPQIGVLSKRALEQTPAIYLFKSLADVEDALTNWFMDEFRTNVRLALIQVDIPNHLQDLLKHINSEHTWEFKVLTPIPFSYCRVLSTNIGLQTDFEKLHVKE